MRRLIILAVAVLTVLGSVNAEDNVNIGKSNIKLKSRMMTPEALWAMGRIGTVEASPNGQQIVYQVGYYSVKQNKSHQVICIMNADGSNNRQLTTSSKSETDPTWLDAERIAYMSGGEVWMMKADGSDRKQLSKTDGQVFTYRYCLATVSVAQDSERIYVSVDRPLSNEILNGLLAWFGMDMSRTFSRYRCIDNSRYYVQNAA